MIVFGVDPGIAITGWGVVSESSAGRCFSIAYGAIYTLAELSVPKRLALIHDQIEKLFVQHKPDVVSIEKLFFIKNTSSRLGVGQARGVVLLAAEQNHLPLFEYAPKVVKLAITGYGGADKSQVGHMVKSLLGLPSVPKPDDVSDALAIALCHVQSHKLMKLGARA